MQPVRYLDRESGEVRLEPVYGGAVLAWLYHSWPGCRALAPLLARPAVSRLYGLLQQAGWTRRLIPRLVARLGIAAEEAQLDLGAYRSMNDFFTRRLRPGARPLDPDRAALVSPADGRVLVYPAVEEQAAVSAKGATWRVAELVADDELAARWLGGSAAVVRLAPADYHRFHFPDAGVPGVARRVAGRLHSVSPVALASGLRILDRNQRYVTVLRSERFGALGIVEIGALLVGSVVQTYAPETPVTRGAEKGYFELGGSTLILLLEPGRVRFDQDLVSASRTGLETYVKCGTRLGVAVARPG